MQIAAQGLLSQGTRLLEVVSFLYQNLTSLGTVRMIPPLLTDALERLICGRSLQNHAHAITLEEYVLKTCPDVQKVVLGVENGPNRDHLSHFVFVSQT